MPTLINIHIKTSENETKLNKQVNQPTRKEKVS